MFVEAETDLDLDQFWSDVPYGQVGGHGKVVLAVKTVKGKIHLIKVGGSQEWGASDLVKTPKKVPIQG